jgi:GT2 family glycosyltransferase
VSDVPEEVRALATQRAQARADRDFATADALRDRIERLGFRVTDAPGGAVLERLAAEGEDRPPRDVRAADVASVLEQPATVDASLHWVVEGWTEDVARAIEAFRATSPRRTMQHVVVVTTPSTVGLPDGEDVEVVHLEPGTGWAAARNAGLRRSRGRIVLALDGSVEPTGDVIEPLEAALEDERVGVCGPFGISTRDLREFVESAGPDVDAIEGYCMAFRRELLAEIGPFDDHFKWYRTADIEFCFRAKDAGYRCVVVDVPVRKHEHRMWHATPPEDRERLSKRNYYRFLERFRGRTDLLVEPGPD